jgi:hypothetical protein
MQPLADPRLHASDGDRADRPPLVVDHGRGHRAHADEVLLVLARVASPSRRRHLLQISCAIDDRAPGERRQLITVKDRLRLAWLQGGEQDLCHRPCEAGSRVPIGATTLSCAAGSSRSAIMIPPSLVTRCRIAVSPLCRRSRARCGRAASRTSKSAETAAASSSTARPSRNLRVAGSRSMRLCCSRVASSPDTVLLGTSSWRLSSETLAPRWSKA